MEPAAQPLLRNEQQSASLKHSLSSRPSTFQLAKDAYAAEGMNVFIRGLGVCSARAFIANAVQWAVSTPSASQTATTHHVTDNTGHRSTNG